MQPSPLHRAGLGGRPDTAAQGAAVGVLHCCSPAWGGLGAPKLLLCARLTRFWSTTSLMTTSLPYSGP